MRLLNTHSLELKSFMGAVPRYAILSHTWLDAEEELTFDDLQHDLKQLRSKGGYRKLKDSARLARKQGYDYIWVDTCCIDKSSSAELSEAINSMYRWYEDADICYAYLSDILGPKDDISASNWFKRGWTLQELIAPRKVDFYSSMWERIGSRDDLVDLIWDITQIPRAVLRGGTLSAVSAGRKLSWAATRVTTRDEDIAYCLMGILDVNMPLLYGEGGEKAFIRLQEEFLKSQDDESIFAWKAPEGAVREQRYWGMLATSPAYFSGALSMNRPAFKTRIHLHPTTITNRGTSVELALCRFDGDTSGTLFLGLLNAGQSGKVPAILLQRVSDIENQYVRIAADLLIDIRMNIYEVPWSSLSSAFRTEYSQRQGLSRTSMLDTTNATLRVGEPESRLIFVRSSPPESELLAGSYFIPEVSLDTSIEGSFEVSGVTYSDNWYETGLPQEGQPLKYRPYYLLYLYGLPDYENLKAESLRQREYLGGLEFELKFKSNDGQEVYSKSFSLLVGLEPIPDNPLGTLPLFVKPWYVLVPRRFDESWVRDIVGLGDIESLKGHDLPNGLSLKALFSTGVRYEELLYKINLTITKS